jgi:hypothetical protein
MKEQEGLFDLLRQIAPPGFLKASIGIHVALMALLFVFTHWAGTLVVKFLSVLFVGLFLWRLWGSSLEFGLNRQMFGAENQNIILPDLRLRKTVAFFRSFAETGEDRLMSMVTFYALAIAMAALVTNPWWLAISLLLFAFTSAWITRRTWPGFSLVLGSSNDPKFRKLLYRVMRVTSPFNTTTLDPLLRDYDCLAGGSFGAVLG